MVVSFRGSMTGGGMRYLVWCWVHAISWSGYRSHRHVHLLKIHWAAYLWCALSMIDFNKNSLKEPCFVKCWGMDGVAGQVSFHPHTFPVCYRGTQQDPFNRSTLTGRRSSRARPCAKCREHKGELSCGLQSCHPHPSSWHTYQKPTLSKWVTKPRWLLIRGQGSDVCLSSSFSPYQPSVCDDFQSFSLSWAKPGHLSTESRSCILCYLSLPPPALPSHQTFPFSCSLVTPGLSSLNIRLRCQLSPCHFHLGIELVPQT